MLHRTCTARIADLQDQLRRAQDRIIDRDRENTRLHGEAERSQAARWDAAGTAELLREQLAQAKECVYDLQDELDRGREPLRIRRTRAVSRALAEDRRAEAGVLAALEVEAFADPEIAWTGCQYEVAGVRAVGPLDLYLQRRYGLTRSEAWQMEAGAARGRAAV